MTPSRLSFIISFILSVTSIYGQKIYIPTLTLQLEDFLRDPESAVSASITDDFETFFFDQTLDHFSYTPQSYATFKQRYFIDCRYWGGANSSAPIFVYLGPESKLDGAPTSIGFLRDNAAQFQALLVYIEVAHLTSTIFFWGPCMDAFFCLISASNHAIKFFFSCGIFLASTGIMVSQFHLG